MPCRSDYMDPTNREAQLQRSAKLLVFVCKQLGFNPPAYAVEDAENSHCHRDSSVIKLCDLIHGMNEEELNRIVYNARSKESRDLADWWEEHEEADRKREQAERALEEKKKKKRFEQWQELNKEFGK